MELGARLSAVARLAAEGENIADIGTDHGYIPVWLLKNGNKVRIAASDIGEGPLNSAKRTAEREGLEDSIEFILADGLSGLDEGFDTFIIAGMGGDTIIHILDSAPFSLENKRLVLQPQTRTDKLLKWLYASGFTIKNAVLAKEAGRLYTVFEAGYADERREISDAEANAVYLLKNDPLFSEYRMQLIRKLQASIKGLEMGKGTDGDKTSELKKLLCEVEQCC